MNEPKVISKVKKDTVYDKLYNLVINGYFRSGESISERQIAEKLGVSRTPVREAFRKMEREGLILYRPKKGVTIPTFSVEQVKDLYQVREYLEGLSARLLAEKSNRLEIVKQMRSTVMIAEKAAEEHDIKTQSEINGQFHQLIAIGTENDYLINIFRNLSAHISLLRATSLSYQNRAYTNIEEHKKICDAIESGDSMRSEQAAIEHVRNSAKAALSKINKTIED